jgi:DNA-binding transcriptional regulator YhcF (GntR family)
MSTILNRWYQKVTMRKSQKGIPNPQRNSAADNLFRHLLYLIATGKWPEGMRLPSIRMAESLFGASRATVQQAYQMLVSHKLVRSKPKSGYTVRRQGTNAWISRHRAGLKSLYEDFSEAITKTTGLAPLPVLRYITRLAEILDHERPSSAFIECTLLQAEGHAREIKDRLGVSVLPLTVENAFDRQREWPSNIKSVITTHFHHSELLSLRPQNDFEIIAIPIEASALLKQQISQMRGPIVLLETEEQMAQDIAHDAQQLLSDLPISTLVVDNINKSLSEILGEKSGNQDQMTTVLLSPRDWGNLSEELRSHPNVSVVTFSICERAWNTIAEFLGMPIGALG